MDGMEYICVEMGRCVDGHGLSDGHHLIIILLYVGADPSLHPREGGLVVQAWLHRLGDAGQRAAQEVRAAVRDRLRDAHVLNPVITRLVLSRQAVPHPPLSEYNYDVRLKGAGYALLISNVILSWRIYVNKGMVWWPLALAFPAYFAVTPMLFQKHNKKLFDMCNVGPDFHLGVKREEVLKECNRILDREDF